MRVAEYCTCGAAFVGTIPDRDADKIARVQAWFWASHQGEGHASTDANGAANARRREAARLDREYLAELRRDKG